MKIRVLGSLSGTEPFPTRNHTSWVLELDNGSVYWFDAGENCSRTAYLAAVDMLNVKDIFISHPHYDHLGGLMNVFSTMRKMRALDGDREYRSVNLHLPVAEMAEPFDLLMKSVDAYPLFTDVKIDTLFDGMVFDNGEIKVEVRGNEHIAKREDGTFRAFSFRITAQDKVIIYSGDTHTADVFADWTRKCDIVLMESGHHKPAEVCAKWKADNSDIGKILFVHHGRTFLNTPTQCRLASNHAWGSEVFFAEDNMVVEL